MQSELTEIFRKREDERRQHAVYFDFAKDRPGTELSVVSNWLSARYENPDKHFAKVEHCPNPFDPPDVIVTDCQGARHGFEVTEFVDEDSAANPDRDPKAFVEQEFRKQISDQITKKAAAGFKDGTCTSKRLIIYCDEPAIAYGDDAVIRSWLPTVAQSLFDEIWLMIPPALNISGGDPQNPHCRILQIPTSQ